MKSLSERKGDSVLQITDKDRKEIKEAKNAVKSFMNATEFASDIRIKRVLSKLAIGHAVYELAEGYYLSHEEREIESVNYCILSHPDLEYIIVVLTVFKPTPHLKQRIIHHCIAIEVADAKALQG